MSSRLLRLAACAAALFVFAAAASAAELVFANGDRLTGKVIKREHGKITFHSDILGDLVVPANQVTVVKSPAAPVPPASLAGLPPSPPPPVAAPAEPAWKNWLPGWIGSWWPGWIGNLWPGWIGQPLLVLRPVVTHWSGKIEFGYANELTTTRSVTTTLRTQAERHIGPDDVTLKGLYLYGRSDGVPTTNQDEVDLQWRHNLNDRLFTQTLTTYSSDKIRLINDDVEQTADVGYKLFATSRQTLDVGGGLMGQYFDATGVQKGADYLGHGFQDYTYKINGQYTLLEDASVQYSPERRGRFGFLPAATTPVMGSTRNYDYKLDSTLQGKITERLSLNLHYDYEFDNAVLDPNARADQRISTTLGYGF
jgi:Protein of unknown function, DUF481